MSFFGRGPGAVNQPQGAADPARIEMAVTELEILTDVLHRMIDSCQQKCINPRYAEGELNKGESVCVDRCVAKYFEVNKKVGEKMQTMGGGAAPPGAAPRSL
ncbi:Tim10/DDP family zinc finger-domain-containing protein [Auriculariales sp. MPI-PUGE-AT-0066]|nr:Tim10/DDP family zinc finger-domain-containing protein [Auriculariales sp. MPI-PUGE-AT-0066]